MQPGRQTATLLGTAFLVVAVAPMIGAIVLAPVTGSGTIPEILARVAENPLPIRLAILADLVASLGIVALGALLYVVFRDRYRLTALLALGWFLVEATVLAVSKLGTYALLPLSQAFVQRGSPDVTGLQALGDVLYRGIDRQGNDLHMLFFCAGAILWYGLLVRSRLVPRILSVWGLAAVCLLTVNVLLALYDPGVGRVLVLAAPYVPFEPVIGVWLIVRGFAGTPMTTRVVKRAT